MALVLVCGLPVVGVGTGPLWKASRGKGKESPYVLSLSLSLSLLNDIV